VKIILKIPFRRLTAALSLAILLPITATAAITNCLVSKDKTTDLTPLCTPEEIALALGWQVDMAPANVCQGYYIDQPFVFQPSKNNDTVQIQADKVSLFKAGQSTASGNVIVDEPGKQLRAENAIIDRDATTGAVTRLRLNGGVELREPNRMMLGREADFDNRQQVGQIDDVLYRASTKGGTIHPWGRSKSVHRDAQGNYTLENATYATCPPTAESWHLFSKTLTLDKKSNRGTAKHTLLYAGKLPVVYIPYINFPLDNERKSGFLIPTFGYNNRTGADISLPFYWNIAPALDMTITPRYLSQRSVMMEDEVRYLTETTHGSLSGTYLPDDTRFRTFKEENNIPGTGTDRGSFYWKNETVFNEHWQSSIDFNAVSDDNYFQDFGNSIAVTTQNQLPQSANLRYSDDIWFFQTGVQNYQTLNPLNQPTVDKIYERMPQVILNGDLPNFAGPLSFHINNEYDYFREGLKSAEGNRGITIPALSARFDNSSAYLNATTAWNATWYRLHNLTMPFPRDFDRQIPQISLDTGTFFERDTHLFNHDWIQTLEPRLFYLYAPYQDQSLLPIFDTTPYVFNFDQLFRMNRFAGYDRIGDANQLSLALTSRWLDEESGNERLHWSVGAIVYFEDRRVQFCEGEDCVESPLLSGYQSQTSGTSPLAFEVAYNINTTWQLLGNLAWEPQTKDTNNASVHLHYQPDPRRVIDLSYSYLTNGDPDPRGQLSEDAHNDLHQARIGVAQPLGSEWSAVGQWSYNLNQGYSLSYYLGAEYGSCCWAFRVLGGKVYSNFNSEFGPEYQNTVMVQLLLKGLGSIGNQNPTDTINSFIPGYHDLLH